MNGKRVTDGAADGSFEGDRDGSFDGEATWGSAAATADGTTGWNLVNVNKLYMTYDINYAYFA